MSFALYVKDKFSLSDMAYRELSQLTTSLPRLKSIKLLSKSLNSKFDLFPAPNGIVGIQQSLKARLLVQLNSFQSLKEDEVIQVKLTGDGTNIGRTFHVINIAFVLLNDLSSVSSPDGNHSLAIFKVSENYDSLRDSLTDIVKEAAGLDSVTVNGKNHRVEFFLGGDLKVLAIVTGIEAANSTYSCVWCKCPTIDRWDMTKEWSVFDTTKGARTIAVIQSLSQKPKTKRMGCCKNPIFAFIPIDHVLIDTLHLFFHVLIDTLHLFLRVVDILINLLIQDLRREDGILKSTKLVSTQQRMKLCFVIARSASTGTYQRKLKLYSGET